MIGFKCLISNTSNWLYHKISLGNFFVQLDVAFEEMILKWKGPRLHGA